MSQHTPLDIDPYHTQHQIDHHYQRLLKATNEHAQDDILGAEQGTLATSSSHAFHGADEATLSSNASVHVHTATENDGVSGGPMLQQHGYSQEYGNLDSWHNVNQLGFMPNPPNSQSHALQASLYDQAHHTRYGSTHEYPSYQYAGINSPEQGISTGALAATPYHVYPSSVPYPYGHSYGPATMSPRSGSSRPEPMIRPHDFGYSYNIASGSGSSRPEPMISSSYPHNPDSGSSRPEPMISSSYPHSPDSGSSRPELMPESLDPRQLSSPIDPACPTHNTWFSDPHGAYTYPSCNTNMMPSGTFRYGSSGYTPSSTDYPSTQSSSSSILPFNTFSPSEEPLPSTSPYSPTVSPSTPRAVGTTTVSPPLRSPTSQPESMASSISQAGKTEKKKKQRISWSAREEADSELKNVTDKGERRKVQNRLAQRAFRARVKDSKLPD